jgi:hypothetical protein
MMNYQNIDTGCIDDESMPWMPFAPYSDTVMVKYFKADPVRGEVISLLKAPPGTTLPKHHHTGTVIVYTVQGRWKYIEHDWIAGPKSVVFETAASEHTPLAMPDSKEDIITLNVTVGDLLYYDDKGQVCAIENWRTSVDRYLAFCKSKGIAPKDITSFAG